SMASGVCPDATPDSGEADAALAHVALELVPRDGGGAGVLALEPAEGDAVVGDLDFHRPVRHGQCHAVPGAERDFATNDGLLRHESSFDRMSCPHWSGRASRKMSADAARQSARGACGP